MVAVTDRSTKQQSIQLLGSQLSLLNHQDLLGLFEESINNRRQSLILSGNVYGYNLAYENEWLRNLFNQADAVRLDGSGVRIAARILGYSAPNRMTWADFAWELAEEAEQRQYRLFLLGARSGVAEKAAEKLLAEYPQLRIAGIHHGYFDKSKSSKENREVIERINSVQPDILIVGFGMPLQERWLIDNLQRIDARVVLTGGAVFDYISGELRRAPRWMTDHGLEWLGRMLIEPKRLWRRYIIGNPVFFWRVLKQRFGLLRF